MDWGKFFDMAGMPLLVFAVCLYFGIKLRFLKDIDSVRGKGKPPLKNPEGYCVEGGNLLLGFGVSALAMAVLMYVSPIAAVAEISIGTVVLGICWKRMHDKYEK